MTVSTFKLGTLSYIILYVSRRDKMRHFAEISHIELLVSVERYGNVVYYGEIFHLS